jgi:hypothetical protein
MRLSLRDLIIAILLLLFGAAVLTALLGRERASEWLLLEIARWFGAVVIYLAASALIYNRLRWRPMWYPLCPTCKDANRLFRFSSVRPAWPKEEITCRNCGSLIEVWYDDGLKTVDKSAALPSFALIWPQSLGRWRRVDYHSTRVGPNEAPHN